MSLTRKMLSAMGIEDNTADEIIKAHTETVNALKEARDSYRDDAEKLQAVQQELQALKENKDENKLKVKYDALKEEKEKLQKDFDEYKQNVEKKEAYNAKEEAYRNMLKEAGVSEKRINAILKVSDIDGIEFDEDGKVKGQEDISKSIKDEWADFIVTKEIIGADTATPLTNTGGSTFKDLPLDEKMAYANEHPDSAEVQDWLKN